MFELMNIELLRSFKLENDMITEAFLKGHSGMCGGWVWQESLGGPTKNSASYNEGWRMAAVGR